jgi:hypothetical protein
MEAPLTVTLRTISGGSHCLSVRTLMTVREVLSLAGLSVPPDSSALCLLRNSPIHLDLSLAHQRVRDSDVLLVLFRRRPRPPPVRRPMSIFEEALRVSDVAFLSAESGRLGSAMYRAMLDDQDALDSDSDDDAPEQILTVIDESAQGRKISDSPLPQCWSKGRGAPRDDDGQEALVAPVIPQCRLVSKGVGRKYPETFMTVLFPPGCPSGPDLTLGNRAPGGCPDRGDE